MAHEYPDPDDHHRDVGAALSLHWTLGLNKDVVMGVHSLGDSVSKEMFYCAAHTGIIFNYNTGVQRLLQGHVNPISATMVSNNKKWIITADTGPDSMLVVWDRFTSVPVKTIFNPHPNGVKALDLTPDARYIVTISAPPDEKDKDKAQTDKEVNCQALSVWDWSGSADAPLCTALVGSSDVQNFVLFNTWDIHEVSTNGKRRVFFWTWDVNQPFQFYSPALQARDFKQRISDFTTTIFLPDCTQAVTGTIEGDVVIWDLSLIVDGLSRPDERRAVKILRLCPDVSLNVLRVQQPFVVVGSSDGAVRFYDYQFRVVSWFEDLSAGSVKSVSFDKVEEEAKEDEGDEEFKAANFLVATGSALAVYVESSLFYELNADDRRGRLVLQGLDSPVHGLCCHPKEPLLAVCGYSGFLHFWNYNTRSLFLVKIFEKLVPHCIQFSPCGKLLAVGFTNGHCKLLRSHDLSEQVGFRDSRELVSHIAFSHDSNYLALAHLDRCVCLYRFAARHGDKSHSQEWLFSAKHRSHWRPIVGLCFSHAEGTSGLRLFSLGEDRRLVEYNVKQSSVFSGLQIVNSTIVDQEATPTGCMWYPFSGAGDNQKVLTMNDEYKFKIWNANNKTCRQTTLTPTYGGPLRQMIPVQDTSGSEDQYMMYATHDKVIGLIQLPLDGNPNKCMGLIAHPGQIAAMSVDYQGFFAFTCGGSDLTVNMWALDPQHLANAAASGGKGIEPFVKVLDGGEEGEFFGDMKDHFYYAQIRSQDEQTTKARTLDGTIPVDELPNLVCALGYFPTQLEMANITNEVQYSRYREKGQYTTKLTFEELVKLYVNHRPVFAVGPPEIQRAFQMMRRGTNEPTIKKETLMSLLTTHGEKMKIEEINECLSALAGVTINDLDDEINPYDFAQNILGLGDVDPEEDAEQDTLLLGSAPAAADGT